LTIRVDVGTKADSKQGAVKPRKTLCRLHLMTRFSL
jgi:hypothetical protein